MLIHVYYLEVRRKPCDAWRHAFVSWNPDTVYDILIQDYLERGYDYRVITRVESTSLISCLQ